MSSSPPSPATCTVSGGGPSHAATVLEALLALCDVTAPVSLDDAVGDLPGLGTFGTVSLLRAAEAMAHGPPPELFGPRTPLGDVVEWVLTRTPEHATPDRPRVDREASVGPTVRLEALTPEVFPLLYARSVDPVAGTRWRFGGRSLSPGEFERALYQSILSQYLVRSVASGALVGLVVAYEPAPDLNHCSIGFERIDGGEGRGEMTESLFLFLDRLFRSHRLNKVYAEVPTYNEHLVGAAGSVPFVSVEGRLTDHVYRDGRWWDQIILAVRRDAFESFAAAMWNVLDGDVAPHQAEPT